MGLFNKFKKENKIEESNELINEDTTGAEQTAASNEKIELENKLNSLQEEIKEIPKSLEKYNLEIGKDNMSIDYTYNVQAKQTGITNLLQDLKDTGLKLKDLKTEQSTLEKIFVTLVKENNEI